MILFFVSYYYHYINRKSEMSIFLESQLLGINSALCNPKNLEDYRQVRDQKIISNSQQIFNISDKNFVCALQLNRTRLCPGNSITANILFSQCKQVCYSVTASIIQSEVRNDGSIIQVRLFYQFTFTEVVI